MSSEVTELSPQQLRELIEAPKTRLLELKSTGKEPWAVRLGRTRAVREWRVIWVAAESEEAAVEAALASEDELRDSWGWETEDDLDEVTSFEADPDGPADFEDVNYVVGADGRLEKVE